MWRPANILSLQAPLLFNPLVRVWSLRLLIVWTTILLGIWGPVGLEQWFSILLEVWLGTAVLCLILVHHILFVFRWPFNGLAIIDLVLNLLEITGISYVIPVYWRHLLDFDDGIYLDGFLVHPAQLSRITFIVELIGLTILALFRVATIVKSDKKIFRQQVEFLGSCSPVYPPYTPLRIFLNRSMTRPLVRGEFRPILFARAVVIWCIALGLPAFAFYTVVFQPLTPHVYTQYLSPFSDTSLLQIPFGDVTLLLTALDGSFPVPYSDVQVYIFTEDGSACNTTSDIGTSIISGSCGWPEFANISISLQIPPGTAILITPLHNGPADLSTLPSTAVLGGVTLFPGSHLGAAFTWTQRDVISSVTWGVSNRRVTIFTPEIMGLQPFQNPWSVGPTVVTLTLIQVMPYPTRRLIDTADVTVLNGISTFGGLWTFLNGAFSLFFGANILYFALGRRPLSALGIVHIFQRRRLERQWHEDFPALHTEGGLPGSESAGIVAFIRERLVNLGEDPHQPDDVEAQKNLDAGESNDGAEATESERIPNSSTFELGSIPDEIPLLDVDVGLPVGEMVPPLSNATT